MDKLSYEDVDVSGKRVLIRVDFNVPLKDGVITNTQRIDGAVPTIRAVLERGAKVCVAKEVWLYIQVSLHRTPHHYKPTIPSIYTCTYHTPAIILTLHFSGCDLDEPPG